MSKLTDAVKEVCGKALNTGALIPSFDIARLFSLAEEEDVMAPAKAHAEAEVVEAAAEEAAKKAKAK